MRSLNTTIATMVGCAAFAIASGANAGATRHVVANPEPITSSFAEQQACSGIPAGDLGKPLGNHTVIAQVSPLKETVTHLKFSQELLRGAKITVLATPGMTAQWLMRLVDCHMARVATGAPDSGSGADPFSMKHINVTVGTTATGFVVFVRTQKEDKDLAAEVLRLSEGLI